MSPGFRFSLVLVVAALALPSLAHSEAASALPSLSASADPAAANALKAYRETYGLTGGAVAVVRGNDVIYQQIFGHANVEFAVPVNADTLFQLSSTTKVFTGTLMSVLAEKRLVEYEKPVRHYLPDLPESWSDVLLVDILSHLSGLPEVLACGEVESREVALQCVYELQRPAERREVFRYNQTNYFLALRVIETVTGQSFPQALEMYVLEPAGMKSAVLNGNSRDVLALRASDYYPGGDGGISLREYSFPEFLMTAAGLNVSLTDMIAYASALSSDKLLDASGKSRMWTAPVMADGSAAGYAQGWDLDDLRDNMQSVGHEGGYLTTFRVYPEFDLSVIVLTNGMHAFFGLDELADVLAQSFVPDLFAPADSLAYQAKLAFMTDGFSGATDLLDIGVRSKEFSDDELAELVSWLAEEMTDIGDADSAAKLVSLFGLKID